MAGALRNILRGMWPRTEFGPAALVATLNGYIFHIGLALPVRIIHMTEFLDELIANGQIRVNKIGETATFHDPCQLVRCGGLEAAARHALAPQGLRVEAAG